MSQKEYYFAHSFNDQEKFIKTTSESCDIIMNLGGKLVLRHFDAPYPTAGDENLMEIPKDRYEEIKKQVVNY